ncbi:MAG: glycosyltransferase family 4 protein [Syntrophaceae bacterium]|nr:glycosyltransferase family 4 protein [Syntrophaceae bacterium]
MKIGLACRHFLSTKGGLERYTLAISSELARQGHEVHVFANSGEKRPDITLHHVPLFPLTSPGKNLSFAWMAAKRISEFQLDVVHSMERIWDQDIFRASDGINPVQMEQRYPNPFIRSFKAITPRRRALTYLEKKIFCQNGARFIMTNSELVKDQIRHHYGVSGNRIHVIYNSVNLQRYNVAAKEQFREEIRPRYGISDQDTLLLLVGNGFHLKGLPVVFEALARLNNSQIKLMVAGSDPIAAYQRWVERNGLGNNVIFLGYQAELERFYSAADLFVLPTQYDPFANVCLEAMACGTPVITTRMNGVSEIIVNGYDGYVLDTRDSQELSSRILDFLNLSDKSMIKNRAAEKAKTFTMDAHMHQLTALYSLVYEDKKR